MLKQDPMLFDDEEVKEGGDQVDGQEGEEGEGDEEVSHRWCQNGAAEQFCSVSFFAVPSGRP